MRVALASLFLSLGLAGCGDKETDDSDDDEPTGSVAACEALCEAQAAGAACEAGYEAECKDFCGLSLSETCADAYEEYWLCAAEIDWTCVDASGSFNGYPQPEQVDPEACTDELDLTFQEC